MTEIDDLLRARGNTHGPWELQARISENLWQTLLSTEKYYSPGQAQALHMICTKLGRIAAGNENEIDHWRDIAGYATLVASALEPKLAEGFSMERASRAAEAQTRAAKLPPTVDPAFRRHCPGCGAAEGFDHKKSCSLQV